MTYENEFKDVAAKIGAQMKQEEIDAAVKAERNRWAPHEDNDIGNEFAYIVHMKARCEWQEKMLKNAETYVRLCRGMQSEMGFNVDPENRWLDEFEKGFTQ